MLINFYIKAWFCSCLEIVLPLLFNIILWLIRHFIDKVPIPETSFVLNSTALPTQFNGYDLSANSPYS